MICWVWKQLVVLSLYLTNAAWQNSTISLQRLLAWKSSVLQPSFLQLITGMSIEALSEQVRWKSRMYGNPVWL